MQPSQQVWAEAQHQLRQMTKICQHPENLLLPP
jgi:hypothetical protein